MTIPDRGAAAQRIALLIDADNVSADVIDQAVERVLQLHGAIHVRRAYCTTELALANLLGNALAHGQRGGQVRVTLEAGALCIDNPSAALPAGASGEFVKGEGSAGFGLGLSILHRLLEQHGAQLQVQHRAGHTRARIVVG